MSVRLHCPSGHVWSFAHDGSTTLPLSAAVCPTCGRPSEAVSFVADADRTLTQSRDDAAAAAAVVPGYAVLELLGRGGMGVVYRARQLSLNRVVALKMPLADGVATPEQMASFRAEAELIARLRDPHVLPVYDYGEHGGMPYLAMEFADGGTLAERVADAALPPRPAARLVAMLARGVGAAHAAGVVHRDLKPANVLLTADGTPKLSDFGLALAFGAEAAGVEGTPLYMAPEQAAGEPNVGPAADVYALGAILYRLLTGRVPFQGADTFSTLAMVRDELPAAPRTLQPGVPRDLEAVCLRCLAKSPGARYGSAAALADDLDRFLDGRDVTARTPPPWQRAARWAKRRPLAAAALAATLLAAVGYGAYWNAYQRVRVGYFAEWESHFGTPVGVRPLTPDDVRHRETSLRVSSRGGRIELIEVVNGLGRTTTWHTYFGGLASPATVMARNRNDCRYRFTYHADGRPSEQIALDPFGEVVWSFQFTSNERGGAGNYRNHRGLPVPSTPSGAVFVAYTYQADGRIATVRYHDALQYPKPDGHGSYGTDCEYDAEGRIGRMTFVGCDGKPARDSNGVAGRRIGYDALGFLAHSEVIDESGNPTAAKTGESRIDYECDGWGNLVRLAYFDARGWPDTINGDYHAYAVERGDYGRPCAITTLGDDGRPQCNRDGYAQIHVQYDARGYPSRQTYFLCTGRPCNTVDGYGRMDLAYDDRGNLCETTYFTYADKEVNGSEGYHRAVAKYEHGDQVELRLADVNGRPTFGGTAVCVANAYDDRHRWVRTAFRDADGRPALNGSGIAGWVATFPPVGPVAERRYFGLDERPCRNGDWSWGERYVYDAQGSRVATVIIDDAGRELVKRLVAAEYVGPGGDDRRGLEEGDRIVDLNGTKVATVEELNAAVRVTPPGRAFEVTVERTGRTVTLTVPRGKNGWTLGMRWVPK